MADSRTGDETLPEQMVVHLAGPSVSPGLNELKYGSWVVSDIDEIDFNPSRLIWWELFCWDLKSGSSLTLVYITGKLNEWAFIISLDSVK